MHNSDLIWSLFFTYKSSIYFYKVLDYELISPLCNGPWCLYINLTLSGWFRRVSGRQHLTLCGKWYLRTYFTKGSSAHKWNLMKISFILIIFLMIVSGHEFVHVMVVGLLWNGQNCGLIESSLFKLSNRNFLRDFNYELMNPGWNGALVIDISGKFPQ